MLRDPDKYRDCGKHTRLPNETLLRILGEINRSIINFASLQIHMASDNFQGHDYYLVDELLSDEHRLIRDTTRAWVKIRPPGSCSCSRVNPGLRSRLAAIRHVPFSRCQTA